ncbi:ribonuclease H-like domain-containing protein [Tanacetum coccineum]
MASRDQQWYMDTGATSHLSSHTGNLHTSSLNRNFNSIIVGNGSSIPVTHSGHVQIPNPYRPLHLRNVLVTPNIIKNLVSVRKFTTDNRCSIDFDHFGFTSSSTSLPVISHPSTTCGICYTDHLPTQNDFLGKSAARTPVYTRKKLDLKASPNAMKHVLRYLRETTDLGLQLFRSPTSQLIAYSDADWAGCPAMRRSTSGYCVFLGDNLLAWSSKCQDTLSRL